MDSDTIKAIMCEIPQFDQLQGEELDIMAHHMEYKKVLKDTLLVKEGTIGNSLFYIVEGKIEIKKEAVGGQQAVLAHFSKGSAVGEMSLIEDQSTRSATAFVLEDAELLVLSREKFEQLTREHPEIAVKILKNIACMISARLRYTSGRFADIFG